MESVVHQILGQVILLSRVLLAKKKVQNAQQAGAYGSGTPMLGTNLNITVVFIGILVVIFGGVAASVFHNVAKGFKKRSNHLMYPTIHFF